MSVMRWRISRPICVILLIFCFVLITFAVFWQPAEVNHYLPKNNGMLDLRSGESNFDEFKKKLLQQTPQRQIRQPIKHVYPRRENMKECRPLFGKIGVFVAVDNAHDQKLYKIAQASLQCYLKSTNYQYFYVNVDKDPRTKNKCNQTHVYYKRHCVGAHYLQDVDWMLFLDGDIGVINPNHCIEEWIDDRVDMLFYERFFNWEIMAGSYLMKNTEQSRKFLMDLAEQEDDQFDGFTGYDNGILQIQILKAAIPGAIAEIKACESIYHRAKSLDLYYDYVTCVKLQLGAVRIFPGVLRIYRRAHGWARDSQLAENHWSDADFMFHAWKANQLNSTWFDANVFENIPNAEECGKGYEGWNWLPKKRVPIGFVKKYMGMFERQVAHSYPKEARSLPHLVEPDIRECYPNCDKYT